MTNLEKCPKVIENLRAKRERYIYMYGLTSNDQLAEEYMRGSKGYAGINPTRKIYYDYEYISVEPKDTIDYLSEDDKTLIQEDNMTKQGNGEIKKRFNFREFFSILKS
jgi:hypothetical protein